MSCKVVLTPHFMREAAKLVKRYKSMQDDLQDFSDSIAADPMQGADLGGGLRKVRLAIKSKGKGKSGGARVITYNVITQEQEGKVYLLEIYDKSDASSVKLTVVRKMAVAIDDSDN